MKLLKLSLIMLISASQVLASSDSLYVKGLSLYEEGKYELALERWNQVVESGYEAAELYYNMGNAAFRSNSIGYAALYYKKALKLDPSLKDAENNLEFLSRYKSDAFEEVPEFFIRTWVTKAVHAMPERVWSMMALTGFILTITFILLYIFTRGIRLKKISFFVSLAGLLFTIFTLSSALASHHEIIHPESGIILSPSVIVRSTPSETGTELFILHEGTSVKVNEEVTGWHNIRIVDGREGWIRTDDFGTI